MSTAKETVVGLLAILAEERTAIRKLDGAAVDRAAAAKEQLVGALTSYTTEELSTVAADLPLLRAELRRNGILLAHARSCLNEVVAMTTPRIGGRRSALRARV